MACKYGSSVNNRPTSISPLCMHTCWIFTRFNYCPHTKRASHVIIVKRYNNTMNPPITVRENRFIFHVYFKYCKCTGLWKVAGPKAMYVTGGESDIMLHNAWLMNVALSFHSSPTYQSPMLSGRRNHWDVEQWSRGCVTSVLNEVPFSSTI